MLRNLVTTDNVRQI